MAAILRLLSAAAIFGVASAQGLDGSGVPQIKSEVGLQKALDKVIAKDETLFVRMFLNG